jgi:glycosyltransferase involved in cell wall biosynthesis
MLKSFWMTDSRSVLHLYTLKFPQGVHEAFIGPELHYLAKAYDIVKIFPWERTGEESILLPSNVQVVFTGEQSNSQPLAAKLKLIGSNIFKWKYLQGLRYHIAHLGKLISRKEELKAIIKQEGQLTHYSYWFDEWAVVLGLLSKDESIPGYIARAHGFDLYNDRHSLGYQPYRFLQENGLFKVFSVSKVGADSLSKQVRPGRVERCYLGTEDYGMGPYSSKSGLDLISVARAVPLKRIDKIIEVLAQCSHSISWTHIGAGSELKNLKALAASLPSNVKCEFHGDLSHQEVMEIYKSTPYSLFLSLSSSEGLPVSMMEAMSFGIPVLSTDVGGVKEIVDQSTGLLVKADAEVEEIALLLNDFSTSQLASKEAHENIRQAWKEKFSAAHNYPAFIEKLKRISH